MLPSRKIPMPVAAGALALLMAIMPCRAAEVRVWTDNANHSVQASFSGLADGQVKLLLQNGTTVKVALAQLTAADQEYVKQQGKAAPAIPFGAGVSTGKLPGAWPTTTELKEPAVATIVKESPDTKEYIYRTQHFEFRCDSRLGADVVREFGRMFEGTREVNSALPLGLDPTPEKGQEFFVAKLYTEKEDYLKDGGVKGSAGIYSSGAKSIKVPIASLGVKLAGKHYTVVPQASNDTLVHEITHQMMNHWLGKIPEWYVEGSAMYVGSAKFHPSGRFTLPKLGQTVKELEHLRPGRHTLWHLDYLMNITPAQWHAAFGSNPDGTVNRNYSSAIALTYYFYHGDDKGDGAHMVTFMKDIAAGKKWQPAQDEHLIRGRSYAQIEKELVNFLHRGGMTIEWADGPAASGTSQAK
ncbi:MAG: SHD1 domain-containing protein [Chthoniobacteraceae bacterium]